MATRIVYMCCRKIDHPKIIMWNYLSSSIFIIIGYLWVLFSTYFIISDCVISSSLCEKLIILFFDGSQLITFQSIPIWNSLILRIVVYIKSIFERPIEGCYVSRFLKHYCLYLLMNIFFLQPCGNDRSRYYAVQFMFLLLYCNFFLSLNIS